MCYRCCNCCSCVIPVQTGIQDFVLSLRGGIPTWQSRLINSRLLRYARNDADERKGTVCEANRALKFKIKTPSPSRS